MSLRAAIFPAFCLILTVVGCQGAVELDEPLDEELGESQGSVTPCATPQRSCSEPTGAIEGGDVQYCVVDEDGNEEWTECCEFSIADCECKPPWAGDDWECNTPLVLAFQNEGVEYTTEMAGSFDLTGAGVSVAMDWPTAATPWLALDRDGNGSIDGGGELFGSATKVGEHGHAPNGFFALGLLDDNRDGVIDAGDAAFAKLVIWRDRDASRSTDASELSPASGELVSIDLAYKVESKCDDRGNCEVERAAFRFQDSAGSERRGTVVDIHLRVQP